MIQQRTNKQRTTYTHDNGHGCYKHQRGLARISFNQRINITLIIVLIMGCIAVPYGCAKQDAILATQQGQ